MSIYQIGRLGKCFAKVEATYGVAPVFAATDAFRHIDLSTHADLKRSNSLEKRGTPGVRDRFSRHIEASLDIKNSYLQPSGTIGVAPEPRLFIKNAFGVETVGSGSSTVASGASASGATLAAGTGFAASQMVSIVTGGKTYNRLLTSVSGAAVTWVPALPGSVVVSDTVKSMVTYTFSNELPESFTFAHYLPNLSVEMHGCVVDKLSMMFSANDELRFSASGPARERIRPAQSVPGSFTTVGSPVTGILGAFLFNGTAYQITKFQADIANAEAVQNDVYGTDRSQGFYRNGERGVTGTIQARVTDDVSVIAQAELASDNTILISCGQTEGKMATLYIPRVEFDVPDTPDGDGALDWSFKWTAKETISGAGGTLLGGNDEMFFGI